MARRNAAQMLDRVKEILQLHKLEAAHSELRVQNTLLRDFLDETLNAFSALAESRGIALRLNIASDEARTFGLDRDKTVTILNNLLSNALRFTPADGQVTLSAERVPAGLQLSVRDTGPGIHSADLSRIFDLYYQSERPGAPAEGGAGIGLALSRELATAMGGRLWAENNTDRGSTFFLTLPVQEGVPDFGEPAPVAVRQTEARLDVAVGAPLATPEPPAGAPHLLVVEDNRDLLDFLCGLLQEDYRLSLAVNGREALKLLEQSADVPDLILTDWMMPEMDGLTLIGRLREHKAWRAIPVIVFTARAGQDDRLHVFRVGVDDYLTKPFVPEELLARIANALCNLEMRREWQTLSAGEPDATVPESILEVETDWLSTLQQRIRVSIGDPQFNIDQLAELNGVSRATLYRLIREKTGMSANQLVQEIRLLAARELLERERYTSMRALAEAVGFRTPNYFSRLYRERFGISPLDQITGE